MWLPARRDRSPSLISRCDSRRGLALGHRWSSLVGPDAALAIALGGMADLAAGRTDGVASALFATVVVGEQ
jgi:hypothetical protein